MRSRTPYPFPPPTPLDHFRRKPERLTIHTTEKRLLTIVAIQLIFLPWALGGMFRWSQLVSLGLSLFAIAVALLPRDYDEATAPGQIPFRLFTWPKLRRFPIFWIGLTFLGYITVQAANPAWIYETDGRGWWLRGVEGIDWLPSGISVPFALGGPWRALVVYSSVWLTVCAVWIGLTRRRSLEILFTTLAANAFVLASLGIAQRALAADKIFWWWQPPADYFVSSFIYKNHAGAFFGLLFSLCVGLAYSHHLRSARRLDKSSPSGLFAFIAIAIAITVLLSYSRAATILLLLFLGVFSLIFFGRRFFSPSSSQRSSLASGVFLLLIFGAFIGFSGWTLQTNKAAGRMQELFEGRNNVHGSVNARLMLNDATWEMVKDRPLTGWGAGSFGFYFPVYQQRYPLLWMGSWGGRLFWEHVSNDYLEGLAEFGVLGVSLLFLGLGYAALRALKTAAWANPLALCVLGGTLFTLAHCAVDFNFYNPAILTTWAVLLFGALRWVELEEPVVAG